ncbi:hypothetical protein FOZ63_004769, partial [Perkinsus olseni]
GLRDVPAERPDNEQVPERVYEIVDGILAIEDKVRARAKIGVLVRKGAVALKEFFRDVARGANAGNYRDVWRAVYSRVYWCVLDSGLSEGAQELTFCLSLGVMRSLVKIPALEQIFTERNPIVIGRILKALGFEGSEPAGKAAPANRIENKIELNSLPLVEAAPWDADGKDADSVFMTYDIFKKRVQSACKSYQLKGRLACYYLSRNLVGRAKTFCQGQLGELTELEDEVGLQRDISELLWERLDEKFANLWSEGRAVSNFGKVYKKADESVLSFCGRVQELGETLPSLSSSDVRNQILRGLPGGLVVKLKQYFGPRLYSEPLSVIADAAEFYEKDFRDSKSQSAAGKGTGKGLVRPIRREGDFRPFQPRPNQGYNGSSNSLQCFSCKGYGHIARDCPRRSGTSQNEKNNKAQGSGNGGSDAKPNSGNSTGRGAMAVDIDQGLIDIAAVEEKQSQELRSLTLATACPPSTCKVEMAGEKFDALVDSGSALALISEDLATRLDLRRRVIAPLRAVFANKQTQLITEETIVPCRVGDKQLILPFLIASIVTYFDALLE